MKPLNGQLRISRYSKKADHFDQAALRRHAAPVASWIAYGPKGRVPEVKELNLLKQLMDKMDGSRLPSRLQGVLSDMQAAIQSLPGRPANEAWTQAERQLQKSLRKLHRRCNKSVEHLGAVATDDGVATGKLQVKLHEGVHACEASQSASLGMSASSDQHLTLFKKMNEWSFLDEAKKLERLQQAENVARRPRRSLSQADLTDVVILAAACLAAPRKQAQVQGADTQSLVEDRPSNSGGPRTDLQRRVRSLLLHALHVWQINQFDCHAVKHVLDVVHGKIDKFENNVGEIAGAAAGKAWRKIKQAVDNMLQHADAPSIESRSSKLRSPNASSSLRPSQASGQTGAPERHTEHQLERGGSMLDLSLLCVLPSYRL